MDHADIDHTGLTGISSGAVATDAIWDAKGDLAAGTGANTAAKVTAGANGTILIADSAQSTGVKWGTNPIGTDYASASSNAGQVFTTGAGVAIIDFEDVAFDPGSDITTGASWHYTAPTTGVYRVSTRITFASSTSWSAATERGLLQLFKNTSVYRLLDFDNGYITAGAGIKVSLAGTTLVELAAGDTIDVRLAQDNGSNTALDGSTANNYIDVERIA